MFIKRSISLVLALGLTAAPLQAFMPTFPETFASETPFSAPSPQEEEPMPAEESPLSSVPQKDLLCSIIGYAAYGEIFGAAYYTIFLSPDIDKFIGKHFNPIFFLPAWGPIVCSLVKGGAALLKLTQKEVRKELFTPSSLKSIEKHSLPTLLMWTSFFITSCVKCPMLAAKKKRP
jgi:hypothetical protein